MNRALSLSLIPIAVFAQVAPAPVPTPPTPNAAAVAAPAPAPAPAPPPDQRAEALDAMLHGSSSWGLVQACVLTTKDKDIKLDSLHGSFAVHSAFVTVLTFDDFPDQHAPVRTKDRTSEILIKCDRSPRGMIFLVKPKVNTDTNNRSVKMGHSTFGGISAMSSPDADWTLPFDYKEQSPGIWRITPKQPLMPGEYGLFVGGQSAPGGLIFDFGIDP